jgi:hypothetical protein
LIDGLRGAADDILILLLQPEMRREVGQVCEHRDHGRIGRHIVQAIEDGAVEIRNQRNHQVGPGAPPVLLDHADLPAVKEANQQVHAARELRRAERPTLLEHQVVDVFQAQSGDFAEQVERLEHLLQVHQPDLPRPPFALDHFAQRVGRAAMAAAGVEVKEVDLSRGCRLAHPGDFNYCLAAFLNSKSIHCTAVAVVLRPERLRADTRSM